MPLADHIVHFSRRLRAAGLQVGPDRVLASLAAVEAVGLGRRDDLHAALSAVMLDRHEQQPVFDAAFDACWRPPAREATPAAAPLSAHADRTRQPPSICGPGAAPAPVAAPEADSGGPQATFGFSDQERLRRADFGSMTAAEFEWARALAGQMPLPVRMVARRRHERASRGRIDLRRTLQRMARQPHTLVPVFTRPQRVTPPLVVLLDVSGSMERYARVFLHYVHGLARARPAVHLFTFGTRLTNVTRSLRGRDAEAALQDVDALVPDWKGGTRIAASLDEFNRHWARRVLGANAAVLLVTDGLDRDPAGRLGQAAAQLRLRAHQVVWLNPLLRFDGFEPRAAGVRALLPHVDSFLPVHSLASLADLATARRAPTRRRLVSHP